MRGFHAFAVATLILVKPGACFIQPGIVSTPELPVDVSSPEKWIHTTPLLETVDTVIPEAKSSARRRAASTRPRQFWHGWENVQYLFCFGDSYTSTSFNPSGEQPNPSNPLGNPIYPGATSSNGPNYVDFLTTTYNHSYIQTYNFGFGGATIDYSIVPNPFGTIVQSFADQVEKEFLPLYANRSDAPWRSSNSLFTIFFGINDLGISYTTGDDTIITKLLQSYQASVDKMYAAGARNFVFVNVPPVDRSPGTIASGPQYQAAEAAYIAQFNTLLRGLVRGMANRYRDTTCFLFDANFLFAEVINNAGQFTETAGVKNVTESCGPYENGTPTLTYLDPICYVPVQEYFWLNGLHPTYTIHNFMASQMVQLLGTVAK